MPNKHYSVAIASLGCPKNLVDTENMLGFLADAGHTITSDASEAEIIIVNTCGFIGDAKKESIDTILEMADYKKTKKLKYLIVAGCLSERYPEDIKNELPEVDATIGTGDYFKIAEVIAELDDKNEVRLFGNANEAAPENMPRILSTPPHTAYVKIAEGCDNCCTYCIIPKLRGKYRSRTIEDIKAEVEALAENGVSEIILIAQDTTRYGIDIFGEYSLDKLLLELVKVEKIKWIRIHYCYPEAITDSLLDVMEKNDKICNYLDIPIQHINDTVLKRMGRESDGEQIRQLVAKIRKKLADVAIRTSLIVGFPGETEEQFEELCDFLKEAELDRVGVFAYSREEDTPADKLCDHIDESIKEKRRDIAMLISQEISKKKNDGKIGKVLEVMCDGFDEETMLYFGRSRFDSIDIDSNVYFGTKKEISAGEIVLVKILDCDEYDLYGEEI